MKQKKIKELRSGERIVSFFVLRKKETRSRQDSDEFYLSLELGDASGRIKGTLWDEAQKVSDLLNVGEVVKVKAKVVDYKNYVHLNIDKIRPTEKRDHVDLAMLVPKVDKEIEELLKQLDSLIDSVKASCLSKLLRNIFHDARIRDAFARAPGGKLWHHNYIGGLLEHTLSVTDIALQTGAKYPGVNHDLLLTAGLLHDIGKIASYSYDTLIDFTDEGRLIGHIVIGAQMVSEKIAEVEGFPASLATELVHLILSHQGKLEQASPVVPMTLEGIILYYADEIDSKANAFLRIKRGEKRPGKRWSSFVRLLNQYYYFGEDQEEV